MKTDKGKKQNATYIQTNMANTLHNPRPRGQNTADYVEPMNRYLTNRKY